MRIRPDPNAIVTTTAVFRVTATTANPPLSYQWLFNGTNIPPGHPSYLNVTASNLVVTNITTDQAGAYSCALTDSIGTIFSQSATLTTWVAPVILFQPRNQTVLQGQPVTLTIVVSNASTSPFTYTWRQGSVPLITNIGVVAHSNTLVVSNLAVVSSNVNRFRCDVANPALPGQGLVGSNAFITVLADFDRDGLADFWEAQYLMDTNNPANALVDSDGDLMINIDEYNAGTIPTDPDSVLKVTDFVYGAESTFHFLAVSNRTYSVQTAIELPGPWFSITNVSAAASDRTVWITNSPALPPPRFLRIVTPEQP